MGQVLRNKLMEAMMDDIQGLAELAEMAAEAAVLAEAVAAEAEMAAEDAATVAVMAEAVLAEAEADAEAVAAADTLETQAELRQMNLQLQPEDQ
mgnify:CR=1 FL=1